MVRRRKLILKAIIMCLMPLLLLALFVGKTYAYYFDEDGNIHSRNLLDKSWSQTQNGVTLDLDGSVLTINGTNNTSGDLYFYVNLFDNCVTGNTYTMSFDTNINMTYDTWYNGNRYMCSESGSMTLTLTSGLRNAGWRFVVSRGTYSSAKVRIMLNDGSTAYAYEPYGTWFASNSNPSVYYLINEATVELSATNYNGGSYSYVMSELYNYTSGNLIDYNGIPNIYQYIRSHEDYYFRIKVYLKQPTNKIINFTFADTSTMEYVAVLANSLNGQSYTFERDNSLTLKCDTSSNYYDTITLSGLYSPDYIRFNMFISDDSYSYSHGYDEGYSAGHSDGLTEGSENGYASGERYGYERGYNDGANSNLETNGMKTLFNSILSYPVNMIKSVFNFEFMGINVASVIMFVISIGIVAFVIKKFL